MRRTLRLAALAAMAFAPWLSAVRGQDALPVPADARFGSDVKQVIAFPGPVGRPVQGEGAVWVAVGKPQYPRLVPVHAEVGVARVDPTTGQVVVIPIDGGVLTLKVGEGAVWAQQGWGGFAGQEEATASATTGPILKIDPATNKVSGSVAAGPHGELAAVGDKALWVIEHRYTGGLPGLMAGSAPDRVVRIDPETGRAVATIPVNRNRISKVECGGGAVWALAGSTSSVGGGGAFIVRIDPRTNAVAAVIPVENARSFRVGGEAVWVGASEPQPLTSPQTDLLLYRIDLATNGVSLSKVDPHAGPLCGDHGPYPFRGNSASVGEYGIWTGLHDYHGDLSRDRKDPFVWPEGYLTQRALPER